MKKSESFIYTDNEDAYLFSELNYRNIKNYNNLNALPLVFETDYDVLQWACAVLSESAMGYHLLKEAEQTGWALSAAALDHDGFHVHVEQKIIELDFYDMEPANLGQSNHYRNRLLCVLAKALRDVWHEERWGAFEENYTPQSVLLLERVRTADTDSLAVLIAWELRSAGHDDIWRYLLASDDGDMAIMFTNIINRYPSAQFNGMALAHVFRQWYSDIDRMDAQDHNTLQQMDDMLAESSLSFGKQNATAQEFEAMSILPDGCTYLKELGDTVESDKFFNGLNDIVNQAHLGQIIYDSQITYVENIPFRDATLARKFMLDTTQS